MSSRMLDLVAKSKQMVAPIPRDRTKEGLYLYKNELKTLSELGRIGDKSAGTIYSRLKRATYRTVEEAVHAPLQRQNKGK